MISMERSEGPINTVYCHPAYGMSVKADIRDSGLIVKLYFTWTSNFDPLDRSA